MSIALLGLRLLPGLAAMAIAAGLVTAPAQARFTQQDRLIGSGAAGAAAQGFSVALSADGNTAIVGGVDDNCCQGAAWVFVRNDNGVWTQQGGKLVGAGVAGAANQGASVALSADGNTAIIGGPSDDGNAGAAWVFVRRNGVWRRQGGKLVGNDVVGAAGQGVSVALSADGNTAIVGGPFDNGDVGAAWVYTRSGAVWTQEGGKLIGAGAAGLANQGYSVALSGDGNTAVIGGLGDNGDAGAAWVFIRRNGVWRRQGGKLVGSGASGAARQGSSVALSGDGNTALIGGPGDNCCAGAAWAFTRTGNVWTQQGSKLVGAGGLAAEQGFSVSLSGDGNTAIVGGPFHNFFVGAAWIFVRKNAVWRQGGVLRGTPRRGPPAQGASVALSGDGDTAIIGGPFDDFGEGAAWVFGRPGITAISPVAGTVDGGTRVTIVGRNFGDVTSVLFGGVLATGVVQVDSNTILATTPPHAAGAVNVVVTTRTGTAADAAAFTYERHPTQTVVTSSQNPSVRGQRVTFTATVTADGAAPRSGQVRFMNGAQTLGTVELRGGLARLSTTDLPAGTHTIRAFYLRNGNFEGSDGALRQRVRTVYDQLSAAAAPLRAPGAK